MKRISFFFFSFAVLSTYFSGLLSIHNEQNIQITATPQVSPFTPTPTPAIIPSPAPIYLTYDQAITTYQQIASDVIMTADRVLDIIKWVIAGIFSILGISGWAILYISRSAGQAKDAAARSAESAENSKNQMSDLEISVKETLIKIQSAQNDIEKVRKHIDLLQHDLSRSSHRLTALADVDSYTLRLYSSNKAISQAAKSALIELSKDNDSVIRYKCIQAFGMITKYPRDFSPILDDAITSCLKELASKDPERMLQREASAVLEEIEQTRENKHDAN